MIAGLSWLTIGAVLWLGHAAAAALAWIGGASALIILIALAVGAAGLGLWSVRYAERHEERLEQVAAGPPDDGDPLTSYELAVIKAIENGELYDGIYDDQGGGE